MRQKAKKNRNLCSTGFGVIYGVGIVGFAVAPLRALMQQLTPLVLALTAGGALAHAYAHAPREKRRLFLGWSALVFVSTMVMEILGVQFGLFFGEYDYGQVLGPQIAGVPLIIGVNWLIVIIAAWALAKKFSTQSVLISLIAGTVAFLFDFLLEPAAIALGFWDWTGPIPLKNYVSWFMITAVAAALAQWLKLNIAATQIIHLLAAQTIFFFAIRIFMLMNLM